MVSNSPTEVPTDLKEIIDWMSRVPYSSGVRVICTQIFGILRETVQSFPKMTVFYKVKSAMDTFMRKRELKGYSAYGEAALAVKGYPDTEHGMCLDNTKHNDLHMGPSNGNDKCDVTNFESLEYEALNNIIFHTFEGCDALMKVLQKQGYVRVYVRSAEWDKGCKENQQTCAEVFLGFLPALHASLSTLHDIISGDNASELQVNDKDNTIGRFLQASGFEVYDQLKGDVDGQTLREAAAFLTPEYLQKLYYLCGFWKLYTKPYIYDY
ncbi:uncharacterized protein BcabD6B2_54530 [Babesia caballi]|uniref:Uncharacterized protein n=1 Tax=Babesia caballi TaxID=5871 RepID=A0AAV4M1S1_BABCB|nr:hypothetical protein, conserved [Babesia caballi]